MLREYLELAGSDVTRRPLDQARVLLTGSFCEQPPLGLIRTLERAGCYIVDDDFVQVHRFLRSDIPTGGESDPEGALAITVRDSAALNRYRFGLGAADFLICRNCGVYVAAFMPDPTDEGGYATLMADALAEHARFPQATPTDYAGEDAARRRQRRRRRWTPASLRSGA